MEEELEEVQGKAADKTLDKRRLLALAAATAVGLATKPLVEKAHAELGTPLHVGEINKAPDEAETVLISKTTEDPGSTWKVGFRVVNEGETGEAIAGEAPFQGIHGKSPVIAIRGECDDKDSAKGGVGV
ncbi:MAG: hypothetical protein ACUVQ8_08135, partial [Nitrososphaeria archaeon]